MMLQMAMLVMHLLTALKRLHPWRVKRQLASVSIAPRLLHSYTQVKEVLACMAAGICQVQRVGST